MRVLITGGAGYIGSHTLLEVLRAGHEAHVLDSFVNSSPEASRRTGATRASWAGKAADNVGEGAEASF